MEGGYVPRSAVAIGPRPDVGIYSLGKLSARGIPSRKYSILWLFCGLPDQSTTASFGSDTPTTTAARRSVKGELG